MASVAKHVYGVEIVPSAIEDAKQNALINHFDNTTFECGKAEEVIIEWKQKGIEPDVIMVDPPRKGCDQVFIETLLELALSALSIFHVILQHNKEMLNF